MANTVYEVLLTEEPLPVPSQQRVDLEAGAVVDFWGVVRQLENGCEIDGIDYEAHAAMAEHQLRMLADAAAEKFQLRKVLLYHRVGFVRAGQASLYLQVSASHRAAAFEGSKWMVDELKKKVPIWKKPRLRSEPDWRQGCGVGGAPSPEEMRR
jgi:molybdopterin synthase catalytic subunit